MSIFFICVVAWFVFGYFSVRLDAIDIGKDFRRVSLLYFVTGIMSWFWLMTDVDQNEARRRAHFIPQVSKFPVIVFLKNLNISPKIGNKIFRL